MERYYKLNGDTTLISNVPKDDWDRITFETEYDFLQGGCPENIVWENDVPRIMTVEEVEARIEKGKLDSLTLVPKLTIRRAMRVLDCEEALDTILTNEAFKKDWDDAAEIDLTEDMVKDALAQMSVDVTAIKKQILGI